MGKGGWREEAEAAGFVALGGGSWRPPGFTRPTAWKTGTRGPWFALVDGHQRLAFSEEDAVRLSLRSCGVVPAAVRKANQYLYSNADTKPEQER